MVQDAEQLVGVKATSALKGRPMSVLCAPVCDPRTRAVLAVLYVQNDACAARSARSIGPGSRCTPACSAAPWPRRAGIPGRTSPPDERAGPGARAAALPPGLHASEPRRIAVAGAGGRGGAPPGRPRPADRGRGRRAGHRRSTAAAALARGPGRPIRGPGPRRPAVPGPRRPDRVRARAEPPRPGPGRRLPGGAGLPDGSRILLPRSSLPAWPCAAGRRWRCG